MEICTTQTFEDNLTLIVFIIKKKTLTMYVACEETYYPCQELGFQNLLFEISVKKKKGSQCY